MSRNSRKLDHIHYALELNQSGDHGFDDVQIIPNSFPEMNMNNVRLESKIGGLSLSSPIIINAMTGGGGPATQALNEKLAYIAKEKQLSMAVGSQMAAIKDPQQTETYKIVRSVNPTGLIFANLGAEATVDQAQRAVEMVEAQALQLHVNVVQELVMPEGDRDFTGLLFKVEQIVNQVPCPVIVKEVGFGMSQRTIQQLAAIGVQIVDIGGFGGTNFATIENKRRRLPFDAFDSWGIKTVPSLIEATANSTVDVIASGGIRTPIEMMKSMILGAKAVGMAGFFLKLVLEYPLEEVMEVINSYHQQLRSMLCALGLDSFEQASKVPVVIGGESYHWLQQRGIDTTIFARR